MSGPRCLTVHTPAKLNLGLEIICKRPDGYHEIRTVMATAGLFDTLTFTMLPENAPSRVTGVAGVMPEDNLVTKAINAFAGASGASTAVEVSVQKRIPSPGGIGGASSDAAATLAALNHMHGNPLQANELAGIAATLGADVPFFLGTPVALACGTGTALSPVSTFRGFAVLLVPMLKIAAKTATLYRLLRQEDFSVGTHMDRVVATIERGELPGGDLLKNAFVEPLYAIAPELADIASRMVRCGAPYAALSGAGPAHYVLLSSENEAQELANRIADNVGMGTLVEIVDVGRSTITIEAEPA